MNYNINFIQSLIKQDFIPEIGKKSLQPGQVFHGKITKLFPNMLAQVQLGSQKLIAKLEVPLIAGSPYWFQVQQGEGKIHLKVLSGNGHGHRGNEQASLPEVLKGLQIPSTKEHQDLLKFFIKEGLPVSKENIMASALLIQGTQKGQNEFPVLKAIIEKNLPLTNEVFAGILANRNNESLHGLLQGLRNQLTDIPPTKNREQLLSFLNSLMGMEETGTGAKGGAKWENSQWMVYYLKSLTGKLGLNYESGIWQRLKDGTEPETGKLDVLKAVLLRSLTEEPNAQVREASERMVDRITGIQLLSHEAGHLQQYVVQVPLSFLNKPTDLTIQWNGKKKENGQINADYCRVLFYLELEYLNEIIVDLQIQNRIMNIKVINDTAGIKLLAAPFINGLRENLERQGYQLSQINFLSTEDQKELKKRLPNKTYPVMTNYNGVDIRI